MPAPTVLSLSDLSDGEIEMLKLRPDVKFAGDGKTVEIPKELAEDADVASDALNKELAALPIPPPPEHIAKRLAAGFEPPASSMVIEEDGKVIHASGTPAVVQRVTASEADLADYVRGLLGGVPFEKTYAYMGDSVHVVLRERSGEENEDVVRRAAATAAAQGNGQNGVVLALLIMKYRMAYSLVELRLGNAEPKKFVKVSVGQLDAATKTYALDARVSEVCGLPSALYTAIGAACAEFDELCGDIARRAADPKLWQTTPAV